jgi:flagellar motor switch protein FliN/FliY
VNEADGEQAAADADAVAAEVEAGPDPADEAADPEAGESDAANDDFKVVNEADASEDDAEAAMLEMLEGLPQDDSKPNIDDINFGSAAVSKAEFQQLQEPVSGSEPRNIDLLMDVDLPISIELGRTKMSISDILALGPGSVVELHKLAGEPVDLLVNYKVVAKGEVVVVDENFGLRITQLMTPEERLKALAEE